MVKKGRRPERPGSPNTLGRGLLKDAWKVTYPRKGLFEEAWKAQNIRKGLLKNVWTAPYPRKGLFKEAWKAQNLGWAGSLYTLWVRFGTLGQTESCPHVKFPTCRSVLSVHVASRPFHPRTVPSNLSTSRPVHLRHALPILRHFPGKALCPRKGLIEEA